MATPATSAPTPAIKPIIKTQFLPTAVAILYTFPSTNPAAVAQITSFTLANQGVAAKVTLYLVPSGSSPMPSNIVFPAVLIPANTSWIEHAGTDAEVWLLGPGDSIQGFCNVASAVTITVNDREYV